MTPILSSIGMNYYHEAMGYNTKTEQETEQDLRDIQILTNRVKLYRNPYTNNGGIIPEDSLAAITMIARIAKSLGMHVTWVVNVDNEGGYLTDANWSDYVTKVQEEANTAQSLGCDEFYVGNEIYIHQNGDPGFASMPTRIKSLIAATSFNGVKSYEMVASELNQWISSGVSELEKISLNIYSSDKSFKDICTSAYNAFGSKLSIGEFSTESGYETDAKIQSVWRRRLRERCNVMKTLGITEAYYFEWRYSSTTLFAHGLLRRNEFYPDINSAFSALFDGRRFLT